MKLRSMMIAAIASTVALSACAGSYGTYSSDQTDKKAVQVAKADTKVMQVSTNIGNVFANSDGLTLYTFTKDTASTSNCYGGCAANWPPFMAKKNAKTWGAFTVIERKDGQYQWAWNDQPLYTWVGDQKSGDTNGHGVNNVWFAAVAP